MLVCFIVYPAIRTCDDNSLPNRQTWLRFTIRFVGDRQVRETDKSRLFRIHRVLQIITRSLRIVCGCRVSYKELVCRKYSKFRKNLVL